MTRLASRSDLDIAIAAADVIGNYMSHNQAPFAALPEMYEKFHRKLIEILDNGPRPNHLKPTTRNDLDLIIAAANVVGRFVTINPMPFTMLPDMIEKIYTALVDIVDKGPRANLDISSHSSLIETFSNATVVHSKPLVESRPAASNMATYGKAGKNINAFDEDHVISEPIETPAIPINLSIWHDRLVCLECGKPFAALKRHLKYSHKMDEKQYRLRYGLSPSYPMSCESYRESRRELIKDGNFKALTKIEIAAKKRGESPRNMSLTKNRKETSP